MGLFDKFKKTVKTAVSGGNVFKGTAFEGVAAKAGAAGRTAVTTTADGFSGGAFSKAGGFDTVVSAGKAATGQASWSDVAKKAGGNYLKSTGAAGALAGAAMFAAPGKKGSAATSPAKSLAPSPASGHSLDPLAGRASMSAGESTSAAPPPPPGPGLFQRLIHALFG